MIEDQESATDGGWMEALRSDSENGECIRRWEGRRADHRRAVMFMATGRRALPARWSGHTIDDNDKMSITPTGNLTVSRADLKQLLRRPPAGGPAPPPVTHPEPQSIKLPDVEQGPPRLAFTVEETAEALGVSKVTVYRLLGRGLLKTSLALRRKLISKVEVERFLKDTSSGV
jgi:excisionase family DNA binding protein